MPTKRQKVINYLIINQLVLQVTLLNLFTLMFGVMHQNPLMEKQYYVSFIYDYSKFSWIYSFEFKYEVFQKFVGFQNLVECLFDQKIITVQTDLGGEYQKLHGFFSKVSIRHHVSCPHVHQQNGAAEQKYRHIVEVGLALLAHASIPIKF
jgi:hypothetical protein